MPYLETELIIILDSIEDCTHFMETKFLIKKMTLYNQDLIFFESSLSEYFNLVKKLEEYAGKKLYKYRWIMFFFIVSAIIHNTTNR